MREKEERRKKNAPTETGPLPQSHAQDLFVIRVRGTPSLRCMVNNITAELLDLDMEPKPESPWRTSAHQAEEKKTMKVENGGLACDLPLKDVLEVLG